MKVLVTGAGGQLGREVSELLSARGISCISADRRALDVTDLKAVESLFEAERPSHVVHCAAYTAVDRAEEERELCLAVNADGTKNVAKTCKRYGAKLIYPSTDYVYDGKGRLPRAETDPCAPLNWYGETKLLGEQAVKDCLEEYFIVRTSWIFSEYGSNFVKTMLRFAETRTEISVVSDQVGSPTYARDLAVIIAEMLFSEAYGTYHAANSGYTSWYDFAREIFRLSHKEITVKPIAAAEYPSAAKRPLNSRLSTEKLAENGFPRMLPWQDALQRCLKIIR